MDFLTSLVNSMPGAVAQGLIWGIMAIGVYITYRILDVADLTVDGSLGTGGAVCVVLVLNGVPVGVALVAATLVGMLAGLVTGLFHTACGIPAILAGILTQLALYSVNLRIKYGNRLIMMYEGHVIYDVRGEEKKNLQVSDLLQRFEQVSDGEFANDRMLLS